MVHFPLMHSEKGDISLAALFLNDWKIYISEPLRSYDLYSGLSGSFTQIQRKDILALRQIKCACLLKLHRASWFDAGEPSVVEYRQ